MEPRFRGGDDDRFPSSADGYFSFQAMQAGFMDGEWMRPRPTLEALEMELREERIKEEIIARRIAQRRMVEEQARREMEIAMAMGMGGGRGGRGRGGGRGGGGRMRRSVESLLLGPPEDPERRFGPRLGCRDHFPRIGAGKNMAFLEEINDTGAEVVS